MDKEADIEFTFEDSNWNKKNKTEAEMQVYRDRGHLLNLRQKYPLEVKVEYAKRRISKVINDYGKDACIIGFSGGKDSEVLSHIIMTMGYKLKHLYYNTACMIYWLSLIFHHEQHTCSAVSQNALTVSLDSSLS